MINVFLWIPLDMMGQVQKMMKYQQDKKQVLFKNLVFVVKPRLFSLALQFCRSPVLLVYIYIYLPNLPPSRKRHIGLRRHVC